MEDDDIVGPDELDRALWEMGRPASAENATEQDAERERFESAAKDSLTGTYNRSYLLDRIEADLAYARRHQAPLTLLLFDIDDFKKINDSFGRAAGDHVLTKLAATLKQAIRVEDALARLGNDEFAVLMRDVDDEKAIALAERLRQHIEHAVFDFEGRLITVSAGVGTLGEDPDPLIQNPQDLVSRAEQCLAKAKHEGLNRVAGKMAG